MRPSPDILIEMPRKRPGWLRYVLALSLLIASGFWVSALAGEPQATPTSYKVWCLAAEANCPAVEPAVIQWSGIIEAHLQKASTRAAWMTHVPEPARTDVWQKGDCERGDCEDKALCMRAWLIRIGYPAGALRLVWGLDDLDRKHAWLAAYTTAGVVYLDDRQVAFADRWNGEAWFIETYEHYPPMGYLWDEAPSTGAFALMQDRDQ